MDFTGHVKKLNAILTTAATLAEDYNNPTGKGDFREVQLSSILRDKLPGDLLVSKGEIFDSNGNRTPEFDIIIHHRSTTPNFFTFGDRRVIPCEDVLAVGEVKSELKNEGLIQFKESLEKLNKLERYYRPTQLFEAINRITGSGTANQFINRPIPPNQSFSGIGRIPGFFFAYKSSKRQTALDNIKAQMPWPINSMGFYLFNNTHIIENSGGGWNSTDESQSENVLLMLLLSLFLLCKEDGRSVNVMADTGRYYSTFLKDESSTSP